MNTTKAHIIPMLKEKRVRNYVFILEDFELAFSHEQLKRITDDWNDGEKLEDIAERERRNPTEVLLALIHQANDKKIKRPFAYRRN